MIADSGPSLTARRVAAHRLSYERLEAPYGDPAADDTLTAAVAAGVTVPHGPMHDYLQARTRFFDQTVVASIAEGFRQIVIGGAGYDGRALRYAAPGVRWFEIDHPATQRDKLAVLGELGLAEREHVSFAAADFTVDPVGDVLVAAGLCPGERALFLLEGVAVYLAAADLESLLGQFRDVAAEGSRLAISMPVTGTRRSSRFRDTVAGMGEPALSRFEPDEAADLLARTGWHARTPGGPRERLRRAGLLVADAAPRPAQAPAPAPAPRPAPAVAPAAAPAPGAGAFVPVDAARLPLSALLSNAHVAFTIEADNEAEHRMPHRTTAQGGGGAWLTSLAMYENCLRHLDADTPRTLGELRNLARTGTNLDGMRRWGYITITLPGAASPLTGHPKHRPGPDSVLRLTAKGQAAREVWAEVPGLIEGRWRERFGADVTGRLRRALQEVAERLDPALPDTLPILGPGLRARPVATPPPPSSQPVAGLSLNALLSRPLHAIALEFERESTLSLALCANVLRVLAAEGTRLKDLPALTGVSKESIAMAMTVLEPAGLAVTGKEGRWQTVSRTAKGLSAQRVHAEHLTACERAWQEPHDPAAIRAIREVLEPLVATDGSTPPRLFECLRPYPGGWRASVRPPTALPHYPMVLHRGGYPDGSLHPQSLRSPIATAGPRNRRKCAARHFVSTS